MSDSQTIEDFGAQWNRFTENTGYYSSVELLEDITGPLLSLSELAEKRIVEIGSGTGRIVNMLVEAGAGSVLAVEPSSAYRVLQKNTEHHGEKVSCLQIPGDALEPDLDLDLALSIGVLHHVEDPSPIVDAVYRALRPGGEFLVWLYGYEGNVPYVVGARALRRVTTRCPDPILVQLSTVLDYMLDPYIALTRRARLPLGAYLNEYYAKLTRATRRLVVFDQLNPAYAKYYKKAEAEALLRRGGFTDVESYHRHGYSWTVRGTKPEDAATRETVSS